MNLKKLLNFTHQLLLSGKIDEAYINLNKIIKIDPKNLYALNTLGILNLQKKQYIKSLSLFGKCLELNPNFYQAIFNKAICLKELNRNNEAIQCYLKGLKINPNSIDGYYNLGNCLLKIGNYEKAIENYDIVTKHNPNFCEAFFNKGISFERIGKYNEAIENHNKAIRIKKNFFKSYLHKGNCFQNLNKFKKALNYYKKTIELNPSYKKTYNNLGHLQLLLSDYKNGWINYQYRDDRRLNEFKSIGLFNLKDKINLKGKSIFIYKEQGLGDYIFFCRYLPLVKKLGANIMLDTPEVLVPLINSMNFEYTLINNKETLDETKIDYHLSICSLPLLFNTAKDNIPNKTPYLFIDKEKVDFWSKKINKNKKNIGIKWTGNKNYWNDKKRSTNLRQLKSLLQMPFEFHSLEISYSSEDLVFMKNMDNIKSYKDELHGFDNTAALMKNMDLIITTDNSVANLCGALNIEGWVILSKLPDFRWLLKQNKTPWYPSLKLYRQIKSNDWNGVIKNIIRDLS